MSTTSNAPKAKSGRSDPKQPKKVVDLQEDEGIIDDEELAERVKAGDLERFDGSKSSVRQAEVDALREKAARWRPPELNKDRNK